MSFVADLARQNPDDQILTTRTSHTMYVDATITPLSDVSQSEVLTFGMAVKIISALKEYLEYFKLYEALHFWVLDRRKLKIAFGSISGVLLGATETDFEINATSVMRSSAPPCHNDGNGGRSKLTWSQR